jgi:hypothetical protein
MQKTPEQMLTELYTVILGVPSTGEMGMAQLVYEMEKHLRELNGDVKTNTAWRKAMVWVIGGVISFMVAITVSLFL